MGAESTSPAKSKDPTDGHDAMARFSSWIRQSEKDGKSRADFVTLSTIHQAKGLEWDLVVLPLA